MGGTDRLDEFVRTADVEGLAAWLAGATTDELSAARAWYRRGPVRRRLEQIPDDGGERPLVHRRTTWFEVVLVAGLVGPATAAKWIPWTYLYSPRDERDHLRDLAVATATARGERWCREFVPLAADALRGRRDLQLHAHELYEFLAPIVVAYDLSAPSGRAFVEGWVPGAAWAPTAAEVCDRLADDPLMPESFHHLLASGAVHHLRTAAEVAALLVAQGRLDRARLIEQAFTLWTGDQPAGTRRTLAAILTRLELRADEVPQGSAFLQGLIATCHGSVGALLLPFALAAVADRTDLVELCTIVAGRPERAQRTTLLRALDGAALRDRLGVDAVVAGVTVCVQAARDDPATLARAEKILARLAPDRAVPDPDGPVTSSGLWDAVPPGERAVPVPIGGWSELTGDALESFAWLQHGYDRPPCVDRGYEVMSDVVLDAVVRHAATHGAASTWATLAERMDSQPAGPGILSQAAFRSRPGDGATPFLADVELLTARQWHQRQRDLESIRQVADAFRFLLARESLERLGRTPCLLSTPSHRDGSLAFEVLVPRLRANDGATFGPLDLLQTLLRLRPVDPAELRRLDGLTLPQDRTLSPADRPCRITDGVDAIRTWVTAGGLPDADPAPAPRFSDGRPTTPTWVARGVLPLALDLFGTAPPGLLVASGWEMSPHFLQVVPAWADLMASRDALAPPDNWFDSPVAMAGRVVPAGPVTADLLLRNMACPTAKYRPRAAVDTLAFIAEGRFDADLFARTARQRLDLDVLCLSRVVPVWDLIATGGGLRQIWPVAVSVAAAASVRRPRPAGLADLLAFLTRYAVEVPDVELPADVRALAEHPGGAKYVHEARALVAAVA